MKNFELLTNALKATQQVEMNQIEIVGFTMKEDDPHLKLYTLVDGQRYSAFFHFKPWVLAETMGFTCYITSDSTGLPYLRIY